MQVAVEPLSRIKIRRVTEEIRKIFSLENQIYFPIVQVIEWLLGDPDNDDFNYEIVPPDEMENTYGLTNTHKNVMRIREDVYVGAIRGNPRDRFTLCHEFGHYILHQPDRVEYARGKVPAYRNPEWQANTFAAELMAPYSLVKDYKPDEIALHCGMSCQAAEIQYRQLKK